MPYLSTLAFTTASAKLWELPSHTNLTRWQFSPASEGELRDYLAGVTGLRLTRGAEEAMHMILFDPPIPDLFRPAWAGVAAGVIAILPPDIRAIYGLRWFRPIDLPLRVAAFGAGRLFNTWNRVRRLAATIEVPDASP